MSSHASQQAAEEEKAIDAIDAPKVIDAYAVELDKQTEDGYYPFCFSRRTRFAVDLPENVYSA
eukprot:332729-Pleurochrysis_carterae.AAC.2